MRIADYFDVTAAKSPQHEAFVDSEQRLDYGAAQRFVHAVANGLEREETTPPGTHVGVYSPNLAVVSLLQLGINRADRAWVLVHTRNTPETNAQVLSHADTKLIFFHSAFEPAIAVIKASLPDATRFVCIDKESSLGPTLTAWLDGCWKPFSAHREDPLATAFIVPTGGTTGPQKAVVHTHRSTEIGAVAVSGALEMGPDSRHLVIAPTLAFSNLGFFLAYSASDLTGGENGLLDVPRRAGFLHILGVNLSDSTVYYVLCAALTFVGYLAMRTIQRSAFGSILRAIRQNEQRAIILGYNARIYKIMSFAIAAALAGFGGAFNVGLMHFVSLSNISVGMSERIVIVTLLGGGQSFVAALFSASIFTGLSDLLANLWPRWMLVLGLFIIVIAFGLERRAGSAPHDIFRRLVSRVRAGKPPQSTVRA